MTALPPSPFLVSSALSMDVSAAAATSPPAPLGAAAVINSSSCGGVEGHALSFTLAPKDSSDADVMVRRAGIESGPQDSISDPVDHPTIPPTPVTAEHALASPLFSSIDPGPCGVDFQAELDALEIELLLVGIPMNARTFFTEAVSAIEPASSSSA